MSVIQPDWVYPPCTGSVLPLPLPRAPSHCPFGSVCQQAAAELQTASDLKQAMADALKQVEKEGSILTIEKKESVVSVQSLLTRGRSREDALAAADQVRFSRPFHSRFFWTRLLSRLTFGRSGARFGLTFGRVEWFLDA